MSETFSGKVWLLGDDIDTDIIIPTDYLALKTVQDMAPYAFSPLRPELAGQIRPGDIIVAGKNFGCGSSREQAPEIIKALGIKCVIAKSFARIFFRNAGLCRQCANATAWIRRFRWAQQSLKKSFREIQVFQMQKPMTSSPFRWTV